MDEQQIDLEEKRSAAADGQVLAVMNYPEPSDRPWSVDELARAIKQDPRESLARLEREGLVHATGGFYWPTRAAVRAEEIKQ
jgi:Mn-dependent DtxR family transcriptional regulator